MSETQKNIDQLVAYLRRDRLRVSPEARTPNGASREHAKTVEPVSPLTDGEVLKTLFSEQAKGRRWEDTYSGTYEVYYRSPSEAIAALLWKLAFYTGKDPAQMDRLIRGSALSSSKFDERRGGATWISREIDKAIEATDEPYKPPGANRHRHRHLYRGNDDDDLGEAAAEGQEDQFASISFAELGEPDPLEEVWEGVIVRGWPALWFGGTGVTKSVTASAVAQAIADENTQVFLGRAVITAPVMYADWELNAQVQGRRAFHIARGRGRTAPPPGSRLRYMSTYGAARRARQDFAQRVLEECIKYKVEVCFIDSVGLAVSGNPGDFEVVVDFFEEVVADFTAHEITPVLIDHQRRLAAGERNQSLGAYGSVWKENLARTQMQIELVRRDREAHTVTTRLRPKKTNFGELPEPIEVMTTFSENTIELELTETDDSARASEETLTARDRVLAAVRTLGPAGPNAIHEACGTLAKGTVKNEIGKLRSAGLIEDTGDIEPGGGKIVIVTGIYRDDDDDDDLSSDPPATTVAGLFANPPNWLVAQLKKYREDPDRQFRSLCNAVAAAVLGEPIRGPEVREEVERELGRLAEA